MDLPVIDLPRIALPFDIPILLHPAVVHFAIVLPVVIFLLELYNLFVKRKSIGVFSFMLLILTISMLVVTYFTGTVDGKESFELLSPEGQSELKEHKLLGVYLLIASLFVLLFKFLALTGKKFLKVLFFMFLIAFMVLLVKQAQDGGELVYEHAANIERVKILDDEIFDLKEALEEQKSKIKQNSLKKQDTTDILLEKRKDNMKNVSPIVVSDSNITY